MGAPFIGADDSTPFSGTLADTSTPTPAGTQQQIGSEDSVPQTPQTPQANELPGNAGDQVRLKKIQEDRALIMAQLQRLATLRWVNANHWSRRFNLALTGRDMEPAQMMYKRYDAMADLLRIDAGLASEERLLTTPSATEQMSAKDAAGRQRRQELVKDVNAKLKIMGLPPVPPENEGQFVESAYGLNASVNKGAGSDDVLVNLGRGANLGANVGEEGVTALGLTGNVGTAATYGAKQAEKERADKAAAAAAAKVEFPVLGQFKTPGELFTKMWTEYEDKLKTEGFFHLDKRTTLDEFGAQREQNVPISNEKEKREARAAVAAKWPGYEKYFPNFVEKGFTDPIPVIDPNQRDLQLRDDMGSRVGPSKK